MAIHYSSYADPEWSVPVETCSSQTGAGIAGLWEIIQNYFSIMQNNGRFNSKRAQQWHSWLLTTIEQLLLDQFYRDEAVNSSLPEIIKKVRSHRLSPIAGAENLLNLFRQKF